MTLAAQAQPVQVAWEKPGLKKSGEGTESKSVLGDVQKLLPLISQASWRVCIK